MAGEYSNPDYNPNASWDGSEDSDVALNPAVIAAQQQQAVPINQGFTSAQPIRGAGPTHISYYGYGDDPTPDTNSRNHIGDRQNLLTEGQSVALSQAERLARFGVTGKST